MLRFKVLASGSAANTFVRVSRHSRRVAGDERPGLAKPEVCALPVYKMRFFTGLHQPSDAKHVSPAFISVNRLRQRKSGFSVHDWIMDSGAFSEMSRYGDYRHTVEEYATQIERWSKCGHLLAAVSQDYMCEPHILAITGMSVPDHQRLTIERYDALLPLVKSTYLMPVLQGYEPDEYVSHVRQYGKRLAKGAWVGVGSVCKRNSNPCAIIDVLAAINEVRPDLLLHGFGLKSTALTNGYIRALLHSADSMAWSYSERISGGNANDWRAAYRFGMQMQAGPAQRHIAEFLFEPSAGGEAL